ncbi:MAG: 16S rRNA (adenine(1518)-N(6)/adenine(1519)-N(6))-dimethyltransferase RsmA [Symbiobacterium sp.]|uniref:16S rRNA (adenine(1518)-N(6)/adenine(1519)-N(6))- dimethyltransferase RsmA n=1 Tax=Symbiobacterium sp. TaxID=1971213 RepID=UPI003463C8C3
MDLASPAVLKAIMARYGLRPQHRLGQNFLVDGRVLDAIIAAAGLDSGDLVLEIGPGLGTLTRRLAASAGRVLCIELDRALVTALQETVLAEFGNVEIIHGDANRVDLHKLLTERLSPGRKAKVVANLPYYITTPLVMRLLEERLPLQRLVVMVQREVADRMVSPPGSKAYGALSVAVQYYTEASIVKRVSRAAFLPQPDVDSAVVRMEVRPEPPVDASPEEFFRVVKAAFGQRRKSLANALTALGVTKDAVQEALQAAGIDGNRRGESLSLEEFAALTRNLFPVARA